MGGGEHLKYSLSVMMVTSRSVTATSQSVTVTSQSVTATLMAGTWVMLAGLVCWHFWDGLTSLHSASTYSHVAYKLRDSKTP